MNHLLNPRIHANHSIIKIRMVAHEDVGIPRSSHEDGIDSAPNWRHEDLADLEPDKEGKCHDDGGELAAFIICRVGELQIEEGEEGAEVSYKGGAHG